MRRLAVTTLATLFALGTVSAFGEDAVKSLEPQPARWTSPAETAQAPLDYDFADALAAATAPETSTGAEEAETAPAAEEASEAPAAPPPLPFHCIEGYSGGPITPMAYLCNTENKDVTPDGVGLPSAAYTFVNLGTKEMHVVSFSQTFLERFEFGYAFQHLDTGSLHDDLRDAGLNMGERYVGLHHFNFRAMLLEENSFDLPLPAVTAGVHFKFNEEMDSIDRSLGGAFTNIGYSDDFGIDYTLTATKMFPKLAAGRPLILTGGLRLSRAAQLGLLGFGDDYKATFEGSVACMPLDQLCLAYEYRMKNNPYHKINGLVEEEHDWHAFSANWIVNDRVTITGLYGMFGNIANTREDSVLGLQVKYEF